MPSSNDPIINRRKAREYALAHPEWKRRSSREYMARKRADPKRRQLLADATARYRKKNQLSLQENTRLWARKRPGYWIFKNAQYRAKKHGLPFDLVWADIKIPDVCPVLGIPIIMEEGQRSWNSPSIDRLVPERGYTKENIRVISMRANTLKSDAAISEIRAVLEYMEANGCKPHPEHNIVVQDIRVRSDERQLTMTW